MRKIKFFCAVISILAICLCFASCDNGSSTVGEDVYYTVTFNTFGGTEMGSVRVLAGTKLAKPQNPEKEGYIFTDWKNARGLIGHINRDDLLLALIRHYLETEK